MKGSMVLVRERRKNNGMMVTFNGLRRRRWDLKGSRPKGEETKERATEFSFDSRTMNTNHLNLGEE